MAKILFISPDFFDYYKDIIDGLETEFDYSVTWFSDRPTNKFLDKCLIRINPKLLTKKNDKYFSKIITECENNIFDVVFVIFGQFFNINYLKQLKKLQPKARFIYYTWDFSKNYKVINEISPCFDRRLSFDFNDYKDNGYDFLPLFFNPKTINVNSTKIYDFACVCTIKPGKFQHLKKILDKLPVESNNYIYLYIQSRLVYIYYKLRYFKEFKGAKMSNFKYNKLDRNLNYDILSKSNVVIDVPMKRQNGLTIRTYETLARNTKLITTNDSIKYYDFYNENNILIFNDSTTVENIENFYHSESFDTNETLKKYQLSDFLKKILGE